MQPSELFLLLQKTANCAPYHCCQINLANYIYTCIYKCMTAAVAGWIMCTSMQCSIRDCAGLDRWEDQPLLEIPPMT